ncbi:MAG: asparagine synthase, partial [Burkholderiales bacterium]|nr:asparagine synthase [Burkholderiales bacterium]
PSGFCAVVGHPQLKSNPAQRASASRVFAEYRARGPALLDGLTGGFALVVHDAVGARTLFAGDRLGIHTLSYAPLPDGVIVGRYADEVAAIRSRDVALSLQALYDYLYFHVIPAPATVFEGVHRLEAAHYGEFQNGRLDIRRYWRPDYHVSKPASFESKTREFRELLSAAVARDAEGTAVGAFLSGGTDSSSVVGWLAKAAKAPPRAWSIGFDAEGYDEMEYARLAAKHFGAEHHEYYVTPADIVAGVPKLAAHYDQPFGNSSALPAYFCAMKAHEGGVARLLAGDGGDEIFGGNVRYAKQQVFEWYGAVPSPVRHGLLDPLLSSALARRTPIVKKAASYVAQANIPLPDRLQTYNLLGRLGTQRMLSSGFLDAVDETHPAREQAAVYARCTDRAAVNRLLAFDLKYTMEDADLPKVVNTCEMAGCEVRFPMLDESLLAFANALPPSDKLRRLRLRPFFKDASRGFLPDAILTKSKHGFGLPFGAWTLRDPALEALARRSLAALVERGLLQPTFVDEVFARELRQYPGFYGEAVWILMMLAQWLDHHAPGFAVAR